MRFVCSGILAALSVRLRSLRGWAVLLLLPLLMLSGRALLPAREVAATVQVGVCLPARGGEAFWELLQQRSGAVMTFLAASEEEIDRNVASGNWDCGLILPRDFEDRIEELEKNGIITMKISSGSVVYPLVRESAAACLMELMSPGIAGEYLLESGIVADEALLEERFRLETLGEGDRVRVTMSTPDGRELEPLTLGRETADKVLRWLLSAALLVWMLLSAADLGRWSLSGAASRLRPLQSPGAILLSRIGADALLALAAGWLCQLLLGGSLWCYAAVLGYVLLWMGVAVLAARKQSLWQALPMCMPFLVVLSLLLSSALVDPGLFAPRLAAVTRLLPVSLYLRACQGDQASALGLLAAGGGLLILGVMPWKPGKMYK